MKTKFLLSAVLLAGLGVTAACGGEVEERFDCRRVCKAYADCVDSDYDVDDCVNRCDDKDLGPEADECSDCIDGNSCAESVFSCGTECEAIVP